MSLSLDLHGRAVLVTGAAGGLGRAIAHVLGQSGADLVLSDLSGAPLDALVYDLSESGAVAHGVPADLSDVDQARALPRLAAEAAGALNGLVSCTGIMQTRPFAELETEDWARMINVNLTGVFHVLQSTANHMKASDGGSIVNVASVAGRSGRPDAAHYAATKSALLSLTKSAAIAYAPSVRVNAVCPGIFLTPMWDKILADREAEFGAGAGEDYLAQVLSRIPLARVGKTEELAHVVTFLLSDLAAYVTGQAVNVDGGLEMD